MMILAFRKTTEVLTDRRLSMLMLALQRVDERPMKFFADRRLLTLMLMLSEDRFSDYQILFNFYQHTLLNKNKCTTKQL